MSAAMTERCDFFELRVDGAIHYHQCRRCRDVLPSFDSPERTYRDCPATAAAITPPLPRWHRFLAALWRWVAELCPTPIPTERRSRVRACSLCPYQQRRRGVESCLLCGCWLPLKRRWSTEQCPSGRWPGGPHAHGRGLVMIDAKLRAGCGCSG